MKGQVMTVCGIRVSQNKPKSELESALTYIDIKIAEFMANCRNDYYIESRRAVKDYSEIVGALKLLMMTNVIDSRTYNSITYYLQTGDRI